MAGHSQKYVQVRRRQHAFGFFRPLNDADVVAVEVFAEAGVEEFLGAGHAVQVEVDHADGAAVELDAVGFGQRVSRAFHGAGVAGRVQQRAREGGFAGAKVAVQVDRQAGNESPRQCRAECCGAFFVMQMGCEVLHQLKCHVGLTAIVTAYASSNAKMSLSESNLAELALSIKRWGVALGFAEIRITDVDLSHAEAGLQAWLDAGMHGEMDYMASHGMKRARPAELVPGTIRVVSARMNYLPRDTETGGDNDWRAREEARLADPAYRDVAVRILGIPADRFVDHGAVSDLRRLLRLDVPGLTAQVTETIAQLGLPAPVVQPA